MLIFFKWLTVKSAMNLLTLENDYRICYLTHIIMLSCEIAKLS